MHSSVPRLLLFLVAGSLTLTSARAEFRMFQNTNGQKILAELVRHKAGKVTLRREDGREFTVSPVVFGLDDQIYIKQWMEKTPVQIDYRFDIKVEKKKTGGTFQDLDYKRVKNEKWAYKVNITNRSRDTASNLTVKYKVFYSNRADGEYSASSDDVTDVAMVKGEAKLDGELPYNRRMEFLTKDVQIDFVDYDYSTDRYKDELKGCMIRILDENGNLVTDWKMELAYLKGKTWENTEKKKGDAPTSVTVR